MKLLKQSWKIYKKNFFTLALAQLMLFFSSLFFLVFVKGKLAGYLQKIQNFQPILEETLRTIDATDPVSVAQSTTIIESLNIVTNEAYIFATVIVPIVLIFFWISFQGMFWGTIKKNKIKSKKNYLIKLGIPSAIILYLANQITIPKDINTFFITFDNNMLKIILTAFIGLYLLTTYYAVLDNQKIKEALKRTFDISIKKFYKFIPLYIPLFINTIAIAWLMMITVTQQAISQYVFIEVIPLLLMILLTLNISKFYKILFQNVVDRN
jgi:hypothetical protein